jgi:antirestriction protein ArdC
MAQRNHRNAATRPSIYQTVTDRILSGLKSGVIPWEKPWKSPRFTGGPFPRNFYTGKPYRGINVLLLWSSEYSSPFWLTFKQAQALKGSVRKGEHGTPIVFYKRLPEHAKKDEDSTIANDRREGGVSLRREHEGRSSVSGPAFQKRRCLRHREQDDTSPPNGMLP